MRQYNIEIGKKIYEFYDLRTARKKAIELAKQMNDCVYMTCMHGKKSTWYTASPNGEFTTDIINFNAKN